jgi:hypothetical protein
MKIRASRARTREDEVEAEKIEDPM